MCWDDLEERVLQSLKRWHAGHVFAVPGDEWATLLGLKKSKFSGTPKDAFAFGASFACASEEHISSPRKWVHELAMQVDLCDVEQENLQICLDRLCRNGIVHRSEFSLTANYDTNKLSSQRSPFPEFPFYSLLDRQPVQYHFLFSHGDRFGQFRIDFTIGPASSPVCKFTYPRHYDLPDGMAHDAQQHFESKNWHESGDRVSVYRLAALVANEAQPEDGGIVDEEPAPTETRTDESVKEKQADSSIALDELCWHILKLFVREQSKHSILTKADIDDKIILSFEFRDPKTILKRIRILEACGFLEDLGRKKGWKFTDKGREFCSQHREVLSSHEGRRPKIPQ